MRPFSLQPYVRFFRFHRWISGYFGRWFGAYRLAALIGPRLNPTRQAHGEARKWPAAAWRHYLQTASIATALLYRIKDFQQCTELTWDDPDGVLATAKAKGGLILTYHHPFAYLFPAFIGSQGVPLDVLALSPEESPLYPLYEEYVAEWFGNSERYFGGGKWFFLFREQANDMRSALRQLKNGSALISLHDFPNFYPGAKTVTAHFMGRSFAAPEGMIGPAVKAGLPVAVGFTRWLGGQKLRVSLRSLNDHGKAKLDSAEILGHYFALLESEVMTQPEFWEGWSLLPAEEMS